MTADLHSVFFFVFFFNINRSGVLTQAFAC